MRTTFRGLSDRPDVPERPERESSAIGGSGTPAGRDADEPLPQD
jgi:hypothetical protein